MTGDSERHTGRSLRYQCTFLPLRLSSLISGSRNCCLAVRSFTEYRLQMKFANIDAAAISIFVHGRKISIKIVIDIRCAIDICFAFDMLHSICAAAQEKFHSSNPTNNNFPSRWTQKNLPFSASLQGLNGRCFYGRIMPGWASGLRPACPFGPGLRPRPCPEW